MIIKLHIPDDITREDMLELGCGMLVHLRSYICDMTAPTSGVIVGQDTFVIRATKRKNRLGSFTYSAKIVTENKHCTRGT